ncbi:type IV pilus biogenesis protein PilM [Bacillus infantis]|jgi:type IV pilus assembly protein PilM|uniref:type IV pilus biogenesis protein PilM n=1 Tax=Bacillus infantis TaxID=324767 RepID=UPI003CF90307
MALSFFSKKNRICNLIINDYSIRMIELKAIEPLDIQQWGERLLPAGVIRDGKILDKGALQSILEDCIDDWKIHKKQVRFTVPDSVVIIRKVAIPPEIHDDEIKGHLFLELGSSIHLPFENPVFDTVTLAEGKEGKEILIFASPEEVVKDYADVLEDAKLRPSAADISPLAMYRLYRKTHPAIKDEKLMLVQFDMTKVNISIFDKQFPLFMHHLPLENADGAWEGQMDKEGKSQFTYSGEIEDLQFSFEDIYKEISKLMDFYRYSVTKGKEEVTRILLSGDHPMLNSIHEEMERRFSVPLMEMGEFGQIPRTHSLALGLALKEVD